MTDEELAEIKERAEKATEGPWEYVTDQTGLEVLAVIDADQWDVLNHHIKEIDNAYFIAHAREDIPKLLTEVGRLQASVEYCKTTISGLYRENAMLKGEKPITIHLNGGEE